MYLGEHLNESSILLVSDFSTEVTHNQSLRTCNFPLEDLIRFLKAPKDAEIYCTFKVILYPDSLKYNQPIPQEQDP